ncbi:MAG: low specificity L-threonine aldolase [Kiloniellales bacterium]|nr:low specificity L-threonine aldolase [Kiloniellales bacterium]
MQRPNPTEISFGSDNITCACPEVMDALVAANSGSAASYGADSWSTRLGRQVSEIFECSVAVFPVVTGTASNALALSALTPPFGAIYCHELAHIHTDECGAPELFTGGAKLIPMAGDDAKISAADLASVVRGRGNVHHAQPSTVSITQASEAGTVYQLDEISAIADVGHAHGLKVHMDGARFANALVRLEVSPAEMTWRSGVDVLSLGGTKNGCLAAEAIVFFDAGMAEAFPYLHKRAGQLLSKMRFVSAQLEAYLSNEVWLRNARQANAMAAQLSAGLSALPGVGLAYPTQANEVFVRLPKLTVESLKNAGFVVNEGELDGTAARFVTAWNTEADDVDRLLAVIAGQHNAA